MTTVLHERSVFHEPDFRSMFTADVASKFGTQVGYLAIPLVAVSALHAGPGQVGLLGTLSTIAFLLIGLPAGAWVDRMRKRGVLIVTDLVRAALLLSVPLAWWLGVLTLGQLYAVVLGVGVATVFFDIAHLSLVPQLVGRDRLMAANTTLVSLNTISDVSGRSLGGFLVQALTAPVAILVNAATYLWSAWYVARVRKPESGTSSRAPQRLHREIAEGLRFVFASPVLRPLAVEGALSNLASMICQVMIPVLFVTQLGLSEGLLGLFLATGGVGAFLGSLSARRLGRWLGEGRALWVPGVVTAPFALLVPFVDRGAWLWVAAGGWVVTMFKVGVDNVIKVSFRQSATPDELLGRMNATFRFLLTGALAVGAAAGGLLGQYVSVRAALWVGAVGLALRWLVIVASPVARMRALPPAAAAR